VSTAPAPSVAQAKVRPIRFHDLRHTASQLLMAGANPAAAQRILRHSDPRITTEVYGHLLPGYLRDEIGRLSVSWRVQDFASRINRSPSVCYTGATVLPNPRVRALRRPPPKRWDLKRLEKWAKKDSNLQPTD
jgi:hypothetical protein